MRLKKRHFTEAALREQLIPYKIYKQKENKPRQKPKL